MFATKYLLIWQQRKTIIIRYWQSFVDLNKSPGRNLGKMFEIPMTTRLKFRNRRKLKHHQVCTLTPFQRWFSQCLQDICIRTCMQNQFKIICVIDAFYVTWFCTCATDSSRETRIGVLNLRMTTSTTGSYCRLSTDPPWLLPVIFLPQMINQEK